MSKLIKPIHKKRWYKIIFWWEIRRIPYNIIMYFAGILSFKIGYITFPLFYLIIGLLLNIIYTFFWIKELILAFDQVNENKKEYRSKNNFFIYLIASISFVFGFAIFLLIK